MEWWKSEELNVNGYNNGYNNEIEEMKFNDYNRDMEEWKFNDDYNNEVDDIHTYEVGESNEDENNYEANVNDNCDFSTDMSFSSRKDLLAWVRGVGLRNGYVIVIEKSSTKEDYEYVNLQCDRGGNYRGKKKSTTDSATRKCDCPFKLQGKPVDGYWRLKVLCNAQDHDPAVDLEAHPYPRRLSSAEASLVEDLSKKNLKPRNILPILKKQNPDNVSILQTIYHARQKSQNAERAGRTQMQMVMDILDREGYVFEKRANDTTNELEDLFFAHRNSLKIFEAFPHVLLIDATYKTNRYNLPLLQIVGVTSTNLTFCIAFVYMHEEKEVNYTWALNCLKSAIDGCLLPRVIVTDRELALMNACRNVFPEAKQLLCTWHVNRSVLKKCRPTIKSEESWKSFLRAWNKLIKSKHNEAYTSNLRALEAFLVDYPGVLDYLNNYWLIPYREMFVYAWTDRFLNYGNHTTNRVESQHAKLKKYLESPHANLEKSLSHIHPIIESQVTSIKHSLGQNRIFNRHRFNTPQFISLHGSVSHHALEIIKKESERSKRLSKKCRCQLRTSHGLPCVHEQATYSRKHLPIPIESIDMFWRKLELSPSTSLKEDDPDCKTEVQMFNIHFEKQSRAGKFSFLKKIREICSPSTTLVCEPAVQKNTRGRPSLKDKIFGNKCADVRTVAQKPNRRRCPALPVPIQVPIRRSCSDLPVLAQIPNRHSCSSASKNFKVGDSQLPEPARYSYHFDRRYSSHPYIDQLPKLFHPFITGVRDVRSDGNCGFRAIAVWLGFNEDSWPTIRSNLMEELETYQETYIQIFGEYNWARLHNSLNFFDTSRDAPYEHWMTTEMGLIIASRYNVILHILSTRGSVTYLPLWSYPPIWYEQQPITIGLVGNHFVKVALADGHPMPSITPEWDYFKNDCASGWATPYQTRISTYVNLLQANCTREHVNLD